MSKEEKIISAALELAFLALTTWALTSPNGTRDASMRLLRGVEHTAMYVARRAATIATEADRRCREMMTV